MEKENIKTIKALFYKNKDKEFVFFNDKWATYGDILYNAEKKASIIKKSHMTNTNRINIGLILPNSKLYVEWLFGIIFSGHVAVPIFYSTSSEEIKNTIISCDLDLLICDDEIEEKNKKTFGKSFVRQINAVTEQYSNDTLNIRYSKANCDVALMISTSGSVSNPKRAMLSYENILINAKAICDSLKYSAEEKIAAIMPLCFSSGNTSQLFACILLGAKLFIYNDILFPKNILSFMEKNHISSVTFFPTLLKILVEYELFEKYDLSSVKTVCFGGGPSNQKTIELFLKKFCFCNLVHMYGQTEASPRISHMCSKDMIWKNGSVGKPLKGIEVGVKIDDKIVKIGNGEICVKGKNVFKGYYNQEEITRRTINNEWLYTGDIGRIDEDGYIFITGRAKNLIIYCGMNIYPEEIEEVLSNINGIKDVLVYGKPNDDTGEMVIADVVCDGMKKKEILEECKRYLPPYKIPSIINFVPEIQRTANGKPKRKK